jgi:4'-phosphopantetheinyl transferase
MQMPLEILCCRLADIDSELLLTYRALLSADEQQRLLRYRSEAAAKEFIVARALLRTALSQRLQCDPAALVFERDAEGKPHLIYSSPDRWHFNLSHERSWVALIVSTAGPVGIDVEGHARGSDLAAIAKRFFSAAENAALQCCEPDQWRHYFFAVWTLKEAHAKARGCGLARILSCSSIGVDWPTARIDFDLHDIARSDMPLSGWLYRLDESTSLAAIANGEKLQTPSLTRVIPLRSTEVLPITALACGNWQS